MKSFRLPSISSKFHKHKDDIKKHFKFSTSLRNNFLPQSHTENSFFSSAPNSNPIPALQETLIMIFISLLFAEVLSYFGLFQDSSGIQDQERARRFGMNWFGEKHDSGSEFNDDDWDIKVDRAVLSFRTWIRRSWKKGGILHLPTWKKRWLAVSEACSLFGVYDTFHAVFSFKHQFAIGCSIGMVFYPVVKTMINICLGTYLMSEIIYNAKRAGEDFREHEEKTYVYSSDDEDDQNQQKLHKSEESDVAWDSLSTPLHELFHQLDQFRLAVRQRVSIVGQPLKSEDFWKMNDSEGTVIVGAVFGMILKSLIS